MAVTEKITNHSESAYDRLLGQFKEKPIITAVLKTWTDLIQEVEDDYFSLMSETLFLNGSGKNLERYGQLFNIPLPEGMPDKEYRELLIAEIMRRSSDGSPDRIRKIVEATTGMYNTQFFEHFNGFRTTEDFPFHTPYVLGCNFLFGYGEEDSINFDLSYETKEAKYLKWASPVTTGSCVLGLHSDEPSNLYIPSELTSPLQALGLSSNKTYNPTFDKDLTDWTYTSDKISWLEIFNDPLHPNGQLQMDVAGTTEQPQATTLLNNLADGREMVVSAIHYNTQGYTGKLLVGSTPYGNDLGEVEVGFDETGIVTFEVVDESSTYVTIEGNVEGSSDYLAQWDKVEVYDNEPKYDQDRLVDAVDDFISIRQTPTTESGVDTIYGSGVLAELDWDYQQLSVNTSSDIEDFFVKGQQGADNFYVAPYSDLEISNEHGVYLEISQIEYDEDIT